MVIRVELYYLNSYDEKIDFTKKPYIAKDIQKLLDYDWPSVQKRKKIGFKKQVSEIQISANVFADSEEEYNKACNYLFETCEKDIYIKTKGKLFYNGQYVKCNIVSSRKKDWCMGVNYNLNYLNVVTDEPMWITEKPFSFNPSNGTAQGTDFPFDFPFDFTGTTKGSATLNNDHYTDSHFKMIIYGSVANPKITIGGHTYTVNTTVEENEYLVIDSREGTVVRVQQDGTQINEFNNRGLQLFEKFRLETQT